MERAGLRLYGRLGCRRDAWSMLPWGGGAALWGLSPTQGLRGPAQQAARLLGCHPQRHQGGLFVVIL